jgi:type IV pilus assembly protein PilW
MKSQQGFTLVELMISSSLGMVVLAGIFNILLLNLQTFHVQEGVSHIQETGRYVVEEIAITTRNSGHTGCVKQGQTTSWLNSNYYANQNQAIRGYNAEDADWSANLPSEIGVVTEGTDVFTIANVSHEDAVLSSSMSTSIDNYIEIRTAQSTFEANDLVLITDCITSDIFQTNSVTDEVGTGVTQIGAQVSFGMNPGNVSKPFSKRYDGGDHVYKHEVSSFFVRPSSQGSTLSLWRKINDDAAEEWVKGIDQLQIEFGIDNNDDQVIDAYVAPDNVGTAEVVSLRLYLLIRAMNTVTIDSDTRTFTFAGETFGPYNDKVARQLFIKTIAIRNQIR